MLKKINRQACIIKYPQFPQRAYDAKTDEENYFYPKVYKSYVLALDSKSLNDHIQLLGTELARLMKNLDAVDLLFLGETKTPWLFQDNDYKPVKEALQFLTENKVGKKFNGALHIDNDLLPEFIKHLFWLSRCNAALPVFNFTDKDQNFIGNICAYGNLHLGIRNKEMDTRFKAQIKQSRFTIIKSGICSPYFTKNSVVKGRRLIV